MMGDPFKLNVIRKVAVLVRSRPTFLLSADRGIKRTITVYSTGDRSRIPVTWPFSVTGPVNRVTGRSRWAHLWFILCFVCVNQHTGTRAQIANNQRITSFRPTKRFEFCYLSCRHSVIFVRILVTILYV